MIKSTVTGFLCLLCIVIPVTLWGIIIGSDTTPSRQALVVFPAADVDNEMRGFAAFENGFTLENAATTCLFNAVFPVGGTVTLNGGLLNIGLDLYFDTNTNFVNGGVLNADSRIISLPDNLNSLSLPSSLVITAGLVYCNSDLTLNGIVRFNGSSIFFGNNYTINLGSSGQIVVGDSGSLLLKDVTIQGIHTGNFFCADNAATVTFENVHLVLDDSYSFTQGRFDVTSSCAFTGTQIFVYQSVAASSIQSDATLLLGSGLTFSYAPTIASRDLLQLIDASATLHLYETTLHSTATGFRLTKGTIRLEGRCPVFSDAVVTAEGISLGDGSNQSNDVLMEVLPDSGFDVVSGFLVYNNVTG